MRAGKEANCLSDSAETAKASFYASFYASF